MFKLENLNQINDLNYGPISRGNKYKYIIINESNDNKKYEIGKRYKQDIVFYNDLFDMSLHKFLKLKGFKIIEIKTFDTSTIFENIVNDFKIVREINYLNLLNSDDIVENMISAIKNHEEIVLNAFLNSKENIYLKVVVNSGIYKYLDEIITEYINGKAEYEHIVSLIIKKHGRNKDLDNFIKYDNNMIRYNISKIGRPKDFKTLLRYKTISSISDVLEQGKIKVIEYFLNTEDKQMFFTSIIKSGIDEYLDMFMDYKNKKLNKYIVEQGRKCDLDILVHDENEDIRKAVARHGYDDHLDILAKENNPDINWIINQLRGKGE